ncbi:class II histocompatibility antigen, B-L beta chain [Haplochromis burtoni]|uniref:class II histocompatibility antigen, B-L beta chain n=1 Tax=Haplochromis burtoni TaxID=8153 RepID=UPI0003BD04E0|nr:class II histocompatibility antigen, B-L beta chain [Haplochromis burtoni]
MNTHKFVLCVAFSLLSPVLTDEDFYQVRACCTFKGSHFEETEYILTSFFNKNLMMEYNSTRGNWMGFTAYSIEAAKWWNRDLFDALTRKIERKLLCTDMLDAIQSVDNLTTIPTVKLKSLKRPNGEHTSTLVCSAYNFYPKQIRMRWMRNGKEVTTDVNYSDVMPNGDWCYQTHSHLKYIPTSAEKIACMVEHLGLSEPMFVVWDPSLPVEQQTQIAVGLCGLVIGFVIAISGIIYYITVRQRQVFIPVESPPEAGAT